MIRTTRAQREALFRVWQRWYPADVVSYPNPAPTFHKFRKRVQPGPGCIMVQVPGMWLGIEPDGYTHS